MDVLSAIPKIAKYSRQLRVSDFQDAPTDLGVI